jgi:putative lipoprotein
MSRLKQPLLLVVLALSLGAAFGPAHGAPSDRSSVVGTVGYRHRIALPADAVVTVSLQDTTLADAPARTVGETTIETKGAQVPIPFRIDYDPAAIDASHAYSVRATITAGGNLLFTSTTSYPVLTRGAGNEAAIIVYILLPADTAKGK